MVVADDLLSRVSGHAVIEIICRVEKSDELEEAKLVTVAMPWISFELSAPGCIADLTGHEERGPLLVLRPSLMPRTGALLGLLARIDH